MFGMPGAHGQDEDSLDREGASNGGNGDDDFATDTICRIIRSLNSGGPSAVRNCRALIDALSEMCSTHMDKDRAGFEKAASEAADCLHELING